MEELKQLIADLEKQERDYQNDLNAATDDEHAQSIVNELNIVRNKLSEKRHELAQLMEKEQQREEVIAQVQDPDSSFVISVQGFNVNFRDYAKDEESYQLLAIATQLKFQEVETEYQAEQKALKESYEADKKTDEAKYNALYEEFHQTRLERNDYEARFKAAVSDRDQFAAERDSAVAESQAKDAEIESLKRQVAELRATIQKPAVATNLDANALADAIAKANAAKPAVYNLREHNGHYLANLAETDIEIQINWINKGKYRVLSDEEAARFREEREEAKKAALESVPEVAVAVEPVSPPSMQFQEEEPTVPGHTTNSEVEAEPVGQVTRQEFQALVKRVEALEGNSVQEAA